MADELSMFGVLDVTDKDTSFVRNADLRLVQDTESVVDALSWISCHSIIGFDIETTGLSPFYDKLVGFSFGDGETAFYVPVGHKLDENLDKESYRKILLALQEKELVMHNGKFDWRFIYMVEGIDLPITHDTLAMAALIDSDRIECKGGLSLKHLSKEILNIEQLELKDDIGTTDFSIVPLEDALFYAAPDALCTFKLFEAFYPKLKELKLEQVYKIEMDIVKPVSIIEMNGIKLDTKFVHDNAKTIDKLVVDLKAEIQEYGDNEYDIDSPAQLSNLLYEKLKIRKVKNSTSVDVKILDSLKDEHEIIPKLITYSQLKKLSNSFFGKFESLVAEDGRLHADLNQFGARSGRFSSSGGVGKHGQPISLNIQQIPKAHAGFNLRDGFITEEGTYWLHCDYSQLEYRTMVSLAGETEMIKAFKDGVDFHVKTASTFLQKPIDQITKEDRKKGKTLNFGVSYGMSEYGLANSLHCSPKEAKKMMDAYWANLPKLTKMAERIKEQAVKTNMVRTHFGRIRWFRDIPEDPMERDAYLRRTFNTFIQGTGADLAKQGIKRTFDAIKDYPGIKPISQIHDELNFEIPKSMPVMDAARLIHNAMSLVFPEDSPFNGMTFRADASVGPSFGQQVEIEDDWYESGEYDGLLYDDFMAKVGFKATKSESKVKDIFLEKPCILLKGILTERKLDSLKELLEKNPGSYKIYFQEGSKVFKFDDSILINPIPVVVNTLQNIGFNVSSFYDKTDVTLDLDKILGNYKS